MKHVVLTGLLTLAVTLTAFGQFPTRSEDHFWRRKIVNRIDLNEKINAPLIKRESPFYTDNQQFAEKEGLIMTLFNGLKNGDFPAYDPDTLGSRELTYDDVLRQIREIEGALTGEGDFDGEGDGTSGFDEFDAEGDGESVWDTSGDDFGGSGFDGDDEYGLPDDPYAKEADVIASEGGDEFGDFDPGPFEQVVQFVEDRIFDKVESDMVYDIQFIEIIWTDPGETLPEKKLCTFRYKEVMEALEKAQWKNRFNDAEYRNMREVFEMRLFHSYIIDISGQGMRTLNEAEYRRQTLIEFEHHLWSY
ncbi:MAG: hypothetical protein AAFQ83_07190 [Bacteroidota bacterium]